MDVLFRGVKVRVDEKWTWGRGGGQKRPKMGGRPLYTGTVPREIFLDVGLVVISSGRLFSPKFMIQ